MGSQGVRIGIQVVLALAIVALAYWLYVSITEPYAEVARQEEMTQQTRQRMDDLRAALIQFEQQQGSYPPSLDSLITWIKQDSAMQSNMDSVFGEPVTPDSLPFSPRTGERFEYALSDTGRVNSYLLKDPNSDDQIGTLAEDVTRVNAASWE